MTALAEFSNLMQSDQCLIAPGVYDGMSARLVELAGFNVAYASGGAISRSHALPDIGLLGMGEIIERVTAIVDACALPIIADADTGYGNLANVRRAVQAFERAGVVAIHLEDQEFPKRCGHLAGKSLISKQEMCDKIKLAKDTVQNADFMIIGRTDAIAVEGFDAAIERARAYAESGADIIFVEAPETEQQIETIAKEIPQPKLINMFYGGKTPLVSVEKLQAWNYKIVIIPSDLQRAAIKAMQKTLSVIKAHGDSSSMAEELASFNDREAIVRTKDYLDL